MWHHIQFPWTWTDGELPPPTPVIAVGSLLYTDIEFTILQEVSDVIESSVFALPSKTIRVDWTIEYNAASAGVTVVLLGSLDGIHFSSIDSSVAEESREVASGIPFLKASITTNTESVAVTVKITCRRGRL